MMIPEMSVPIATESANAHRLFKRGDAVLITYGAGRLFRVAATVLNWSRTTEGVFYYYVRLVAGRGLDYDVAESTLSPASLAPSSAVLLEAYNVLSGHGTGQAQDLARAIIQGDTSGRLPAKSELLRADDCVGEYFIPAILAPTPARCAPAQAVAPLASQDVRRLAMMCVYYDNVRGAAVTTCGHVLLCFPCGPLAAASGLVHPGTLEPLRPGDMVHKRLVEDGDERARYPDFLGVLDEAHPRQLIATLDVQALRDQLAGIARASRFVKVEDGIRARVRHEGQDIFFNATRCERVLRAMQASGTTRVQLEVRDSRSPLQFSDVDQAGKLALLMPLSPGYDQAFCSVLDTTAGLVVADRVAPPCHA